MTSSSISIPTANTTTSNDPSVLTRELEGITTQIESRARKQQRLLERTQAPGDVLRAKNLVKSYISENSIDVNKAKELLKRLNIFCSKNNNSVLLRTTNALGSSLQRALEDSNQIETKLLERIQKLESESASRAAVHLAKYQDDEDLEENNEMFDLDENEQQQQQQAVQQRSNSQTLTSELFEAAFHERSKEITLLVQGVSEINGMMHDLNQMVIAQGEELDTVEENMDSTHANTVKAATSLRGAAGHQSESGKMFLVCGAIVFVIILIISAIVAAK